MLELKEKLEQLKNFDYEIELSNDKLTIKDFVFWDNCENSWSHSADIEIWNDGDSWCLDWNDGYPLFCRYPSIEGVIYAIEIRL